MVSSSVAQKSIDKFVVIEEEAKLNEKLESVDFLNCLINKPRQMKFLIKNTSGISTTFRLLVKNFYPLEFKDDSFMKDTVISFHEQNKKSLKKSNLDPI